MYGVGGVHEDGGGAGGVEGGDDFGGDDGAFADSGDDDAAFGAEDEADDGLEVVVDVLLEVADGVGFFVEYLAGECFDVYHVVCC